MYYKMFYGYLIAGPLRDKLGMERAMAHLTGSQWDEPLDGEPDDAIMGTNWKERQGLPVPGSIEGVVVRAGLLTDGPCLADKAENDKAPYRYVINKEQVSGSISREDVAHFIFKVVWKRWDEFKNKTVNVA